MGKGKKKRMAKANRAAVTKAAKAIKAAKPRNPQDATLRNTRAAASRADDLRKHIIEQGTTLLQLTDMLARISDMVGEVLTRVESLEAQARSAAPAPLIPAP